MFWESRVEVLFQYRFFKKVIGKKSCFAFLFNCIDGTRTPLLSSQKDDTIALWKMLFHLLLNVFWLSFGLLTFGLGWPEAIRNQILSAGM